MPESILGISAFYHDSAAALVVDGRIVAAAQQERFSRIKHDAAYPADAVGAVLDESGILPSDLQCVAFYDKPFIKFERLLETYHAFAPRGLVSFGQAMPVWIKEKLFMKKLLRDKLAAAGIPSSIPLLFPEHHLSHAASAFYPSPFEEAAILALDGVGEWSTTSISHGTGSAITVLKELQFPHSLGLFYSAFTYFCGFKVNSGEYKLMGLAPFGTPGSERVDKFKEIIRRRLIDIRPDGSFLLNMRHFNYATGLTMCRDRDWLDLFGIPRRLPESELTQPYMDLALAVQQITDEIVLKLARSARDATGSKNLVLAGGVALNSVSNGKIHESGLFEGVWIQPAAGDAGGALGAALAARHLYLGRPRVAERPDSMRGSYLGPAFSNRSVERLIARHGAKSTRFESFDVLASTVAGLLADGKIVGWFQGHMEFGPRALGNRSILADPRNPEMQKRLNLKIKFRESFRPFAPSVLEEDIAEFCESPTRSPYMLLVLPIKRSRRLPPATGSVDLPTLERISIPRSDIPAVTHLDYSARVQTVSREVNERFWLLLSEFKKLTGQGILINTSFNVRGEPIVCTPEDALACFMNTGMDYLVINDFLFAKDELRGLEGRFPARKTDASD